MSACNILTRVLLPKKDPNIAEVRFVPGGNPVPAQYHIPLMKKVPMFPAPTGCLELYTSKIGHQAYINKKRHGFDLTDPYNYNIDWSYNITQDPHMLHVIRTPAMMKRLKELGQITNDERVRCTLKQFNNFRAYLKCKSLIDFRNQLQEEKARIPKIDVGESLEVVAIEHRVHEQEVRFRRLKSEDETFAKYQSHLTQSETKFNIRKRKRQEVNGVLARKRASIEKHRQDVYRRSLRIAHQRHRNLLQTWKQHAQRQISHLQEVDSSRLEEKLQVKWNARRETQLAYEELVEVSRAAENDRRERSKVVLDLEMNRRWQLQAHKLQMLKDVSRKIQAQREEAYARNLIKAFANSSILNPQKKPKPTPTEDKSTKTPDAVDMSSIPKFKTIFCKPVKKSLWVLEKELKKMGVTTRILATVASKEKEVSVRKMEVDSALAIASRTTISKRAYPTSVELMGGENAHMKAGEEIWVLKKREDIVNDTVDEVTDAPESEESDSDIVKEENIASRDVSAMGGFIGLLPEDLELMEGLLTRLLDNVQEGRLNQADLVQMIMFCSTLQSAQLTHIEQTTSTTSLMAQEIVAHSMALLRDDIIMRRMSPTDLLATAANIRACQSEISSVSSDRLEILLKDTMEKMADDIDIDEDDYNEYFLEQMLRSTVANLTVDIERGTLSRTNVHEIGSALAQAVMDDMDSDDSLMAEDTLMTILQQLQQDIDTGQIDEKLLDKALASLVSSYGQVLRGRSNIDVIKELVLYVLLRTRHDLEGDLLDKEDFLKQLQLAKVEAGIYGMELPELPELVEETSKAIGKFKGIGRPDEAVVALIKMILGPGRRIMPAIAKSRVHWISESMIEQAEGSEVQLQIVLDLAASVCASFTQQMNEDMDFARDAERVLGPRFLVMLFSYWDQLDLEKGRETVAVQTRADELANLAGVKATLAENVVLVCFNWLWQDALNNRLPVCIMPHVALDTAEFPSTRPLLDRIRNFGNYMDKMNLVDDMVLKKVRKVGQELQEGGLGHEEAQALLTICVHSYLREVVFCDRSDDIVENGSEPPGMVSNVQFLITTCARSVLEYIQNKVARRLSALGHTALELSMVTDILMEAASDSIGALNTFVTNNSEAAEDELLQLDPLIKTSQWNALRKDPICKPQEIPPFLKKLIGTAKRARELAPKQTPDNKSVINQPSFKVVKDLIRRELWQIAKEVASLFNGLVSLHNLLPPKPSVTTEALLHFAKSLLLELRHAVIEQTLPLEFAYDFVKQIAEKKCPIEAKESADRLVHVIMKMVKDIELRNDRSNYYVRIVMGLSKMSLPKKEDEDVAAGMAAIAHLLSTVDKSGADYLSAKHTDVHAAQHPRPSPRRRRI
ncbi:uncharacterized protein LOC112559854 isoform X2 [Pomacea canaliculata]|uniref:uncharacterized protein LOC112559854 isoform X2 n=1 Tax=Pomacea canaliculata TaxID=400727 RepID=UPI000D726A65|nr:uncharacterized protein LOC112559854 isoform X2 [Pomacea canaliculata]